MPLNIMILGGYGFIGRRLAVYLRGAGHQVAAPARKVADVADPDSLKVCLATAQPDVVINLAAVSTVTHDDIAALYQTNLVGHLRVLEAVAEVAATSKVFLASTANVYGSGEAGQAFRETAAPRPLNHYALSKLAAELLHTQYQGGGARCAVRMFNCIGRGQASSFLVAKLVRAFRNRDEVVELGNIAISRDFVDVRDLCGMWEALLSARSTPEVVNFGNGEAVAIVDILETLERLSGHRPSIRTASHLVRAADLTYQRADNGIISALGYRRRHSLEDTLVWMLADEDENGET